MKSLLHTVLAVAVTAAASLAPAQETAPAEFAAGLARERARWASFVKRNGITADQ